MDQYVRRHVTRDCAHCPGLRGLYRESSRSPGRGTPPGGRQHRPVSDRGFTFLWYFLRLIPEYVVQVRELSRNHYSHSTEASSEATCRVTKGRLTGGLYRGLFRATYRRPFRDSIDTLLYRYVKGAPYAIGGFYSMDFPESLVLQRFPGNLLGHPVEAGWRRSEDLGHELFQLHIQQLGLVVING